MAVTYLQYSVTRHLGECAKNPRGCHVVSRCRKVEEKQIIYHRQPLQTSSICNWAVWHNYAPNIAGWSCGSRVVTSERMKNASAQSVGESRKRPRLLRNRGRSSACWMEYNGRCLLGHEQHVETLQGYTQLALVGTWLTAWPYKGIYVNSVFVEEQTYSILIGAGYVGMSLVLKSAINKFGHMHFFFAFSPFQSHFGDFRPYWCLLDLSKNCFPLR